MYGGLVVKALNGMKTEIYLVETETRRDPPKKRPRCRVNGKGHGQWGSPGLGEFWTRSRSCKIT